MNTEKRLDYGGTPNDQPAAVVVELAAPAYGSLDDGALERVRSLLLGLAEELAPAPVIVDLSRIGLFGARFVGVLIETWRALRKRKRRFAICGLPSNAGRLIHALQLDRLLHVYATQPAALEELAWAVGRSPGGPTSTMQVRIVTERLARDPSLLRLHYFGDDGDPIHCEFVPRTELHERCTVLASKQRVS